MELAQTRLPVGFVKHRNCIITNYDASIDYDVAAAIRGKPAYAQYSAWNFCGYVWWQHNRWFCEVWVHKHWIRTFYSDDLNELRVAVSNEYGYE